MARDETNGRVFFLPPDESGRLMQIDLSDDMIVGQLFGSGAWQDVMELLQVGLERESTHMSTGRVVRGGRGR